MEQRALDDFMEARRAASGMRDEVFARADKAYKEAKYEADIVYEEAKKKTIDKQAKKALDKAHKYALQEAKKGRDAILGEAQAAFGVAWEQTEEDYKGGLAKSREVIDGAKKVYDEARKQAEIVSKEAKGKASDKQAKNDADEAHRKAVEQAQKDYDETISK
ncbi:hypothetical protein ACFLV3_05815 [Chloroflexota bacterium]